MIIILGESQRVTTIGKTYGKAAMIPGRCCSAILHLLVVTTIGSKATIAGQLLVTSFVSDRVGRYEGASGDYLNSLEAGGLDGPLTAKIGPDDLLYITSEGSNQVKRYNWRTGAFIDNFIPRGAGGLNGPTGITWDASGDLYVASFNNDAVLKYDGVTGQFLTTAVTPGQGGLNGPDNGMLFGADGMLYIPSYFSNQVLRFDLTANASEVFINGIGRPRVLVFHDEQLFITSETADSVKRYDLTGAFLNDFIRPGKAILDTPVGLEFFDDAWLVTSATMDKVLKFDRNGQLIDAEFIAGGSGGIDGPTFLTAIVPEPSAHIVLLVLLLAVIMKPEGLRHWHLVRSQRPVRRELARAPRGHLICDAKRKCLGLLPSCAPGNENDDM